MKRFITICLVVVALLSAITTSRVRVNETVVDKAGLNSQQSLPVERQSGFNANDLFLSVGIGNPQIRLSHLFQYLSLRLTPSLSNLSRINHSVQVDQQKFATCSLSFLLKSAFNQLNGYYLFHLCKLLI